MTEWISVKDRLPEESEPVIVYLSDQRNSGIGIAYHLDDKWWGGIGINQTEPYVVIYYHDGGQSTLLFHYVTHWMPLPEPPK